jgi:hypothetical protein
LPWGSGECRNSTNSNVRFCKVESGFDGEEVIEANGGLVTAMINKLRGNLWNHPRILVTIFKIDRDRQKEDKE